MEKIPGLYTQVRHDMMEAGKTYAQIAEELQARHPGERGLSVRSVRRFCFNHGIRSSSGLSDAHLDKVVASGIAKVCGSTVLYGHGSFHTRGIIKRPPLERNRSQIPSVGRTCPLAAI